MNDDADDLALQLARDAATGRATHRQLYETFPSPALAPSLCGGPVSVLWSRPDTVDGRPVVIELYVCDECARAVVVDATSRRVRNEYRPDPRDLVAALGRELDAKRGGAR